MAYTARQCWEGVLTELGKAGAPSLLLHEFNYYFNKTITLYLNKRYNIYDINQQTTDDLRVLKSTAILDVAPIYDSDKLTGANNYGSISKEDIEKYKIGNFNMFGATYEVILPDDYVHMLNCICIYKVKKSTNKCYNIGDYVKYAAKRLTADVWPTIMNNYYFKPSPERPYYYIHNVNLLDQLPTNEYSSKVPGSTDLIWVEDSNTGSTKVTLFPRTIKLGNINTSLVEDIPGLRHANSSKVRCEIRYGYDNSEYELEKVFIDYLKAPQIIKLTKELIDLTEDTSLIMELPDYVCDLIINELVTLIMARDNDPRILIHPQVTLSIASPVQQLTQ